jgi:hypothetical protein
VLQVDLPHEAPCPTGGQSAPIPGLALTLETSGRPVQVMYHVQFVASPTGAIHIIPVIDGESASGQVDRSIGDCSGQQDVISFSRVYSLAKGTHTFALSFSCQSGVDVTVGWLTIYELPKH